MVVLFVVSFSTKIGNREDFSPLKNGEKHSDLAIFYSKAEKSALPYPSCARFPTRINAHRG